MEKNTEWLIDLKGGGAEGEEENHKQTRYWVQSGAQGLIPQP